MAPTEPSTSTGTFKESEIKMLALGYLCLDSDPKVDYHKLAALTGLAFNSVRQQFPKIRARIKEMAEIASAAANADGSEADGKKATKPKAPKSRKRKAADDEEKEKPAKKVKGKKVKAEPEEEPESENED